MHYFNIVVHGQVCNCVVIWNSHSGVLSQYSTCRGNTVRFHSSGSFTSSPLILALSSYRNLHWTAPLFRLRRCSPQSPAKQKGMNQRPCDSSHTLSVTYSVHALSIERHDCVGRVAHEDTFITDVIWGALHRHHGLRRQSEIIPPDSFTVRRKWK